MVFCSFGDDITPPPRALDRILELYGSVDDLIANGQTIVHSLTPDGPASASCPVRSPRRRHQESALNMNPDRRDAPPGLYNSVADGHRWQDRELPTRHRGYVAQRIGREPSTTFERLGGNDEIDERKFGDERRAYPRSIRVCYGAFVRSFRQGE